MGSWELGVGSGEWGVGSGEWGRERRLSFCCKGYYLYAINKTMVNIRKYCIIA
ncbi:MAG: hypothetical protein KME64_27395 [Scytonematopsis contorta HA4267-MV1]|nr:hypothetical protein [Scytonematopsis contorta HA4267-MV1]